MTETFAPQGFRMTTGRHCGELISTLPTSYLKAVRAMESHWDMAEVKAELARRGPEVPPRIAYTSDELEAHARRIVKCWSCRAPVIWFKTRLGKNMPVNADTVTPIDAVLELPRHVSHFATCKNASQHRKRK